MNELDACRAAKLLLDSKGEDALAYALGRVAELTMQGDIAGRATWLRIAAAIDASAAGRDVSEATCPVTATVIQFPPQLRVVGVSVDGPVSEESAMSALVEHNGRTYRLADLMARLSPAELEQVEATAPRSGQAAWDEVVRRWPALADEIVASVCNPLRPASGP